MKNILLLLGLVFSLPSWSQPAPLKDALKPHLSTLDRICAAYITKNYIPGLSLGVIYDGRLVHTVNVGKSDVSLRAPATSSTVYRIASMSKSFTAMAILLLREEKKLSLDDPLAKYFKELKGLTYPTRDAEPITLRHLLTHTAGFPEDNPWGDRQLSDSDKDFSELLRKKFSFSTTPGTTYEYSNLGFALLGRIITQVANMPYQDYIRQRIWKPLRMTSTYWEYENVPDILLAHGYQYLEGRWQEEALLHDHPKGSWGAMGGMLSSVEDMAAYLQFHLSAWPPSDLQEAKPLRRSAVREMHRPSSMNGLQPNYMLNGRACPIATGYGYGLRWTLDCEGRTYVGHSGGLPGFGSHWMVMPEYGLGIVALANRTYAPMTALNMQLLDTLVRLSGLMPRLVPVTHILEDRKMKLGALIVDWKGAEESGIFAENFFLDYPIERLRRLSADLFARVGAVRSLGTLVAENRLRGSFTILCEQGRLEVTFTMSPDNPPLIQSCRIREL
ncbi:MAG: beta-lactamase family protein [Bacteroidetes bacterium]|nr:beta-lactamase family protein [Bacteroidota bacterium]